MSGAAGPVPADLNTLHSSQLSIPCAEKICLKGCLRSAWRPHVRDVLLIFQFCCRKNNQTRSRALVFYRKAKCSYGFRHLRVCQMTCGAGGGRVGDGRGQRSGLFFSLDLHETKSVGSFLTDIRNMICWESVRDVQNADVHCGHKGWRGGGDSPWL